MTVSRLLSEASSQELTDWQEFLRVDAKVREEQQRRAAEDASIMGSD